MKPSRLAWIVFEGGSTNPAAPSRTSPTVPASERPSRTTLRLAYSDDPQRQLVQNLASLSRDASSPEIQFRGDFPNWNLAAWTQWMSGVLSAIRKGMGPETVTLIMVSESSHPLSPLLDSPAGIPGWDAQASEGSCLVTLVRGAAARSDAAAREWLSPSIASIPDFDPGTEGIPAPIRERIRSTLPGWTLRLHGPDAKAPAFTPAGQPPSLTASQKSLAPDTTPPPASDAGARTAGDEAPACEPTPAASSEAASETERPSGSTTGSKAGREPSAEPEGIRIRCGQVLYSYHGGLQTQVAWTQGLVTDAVRAELHHAYARGMRLTGRYHRSIYWIQLSTGQYALVLGIHDSDTGNRGFPGYRAFVLSAEDAAKAAWNPFPIVRSILRDQAWSERWTGQPDLAAVELSIRPLPTFAEVGEKWVDLLTHHPTRLRQLLEAMSSEVPTGVLASWDPEQIAAAIEFGVVAETPAMREGLGFATERWGAFPGDLRFAFVATDSQAELRDKGIRILDLTAVAPEPAGSDWSNLLSALARDTPEGTAEAVRLYLGLKRLESDGETSRLFDDWPIDRWADLIRDQLWVLQTGDARETGPEKEPFQQGCLDLVLRAIPSAAIWKRTKDVRLPFDAALERLATWAIRTTSSAQGPEQPPSWRASLLDLLKAFPPEHVATSIPGAAGSALSRQGSGIAADRVSDPGFVARIGDALVQCYRYLPVEASSPARGILLEWLKRLPGAGVHLGDIDRWRREEKNRRQAQARHATPPKAQNNKPKHPQPAHGHDREPSRIGDPGLPTLHPSPSRSGNQPRSASRFDDPHRTREELPDPDRIPRWVVIGFGVAVVVVVVLLVVFDRMLFAR